MFCLIRAMKEEYFPQNEYHTPPDTPRRLGDRLMMGTRVYFMTRFLGYLFKSRRIALQGKYDRAAWTHASFEFFDLIEQCGGRFHITGIDHFRNLKEPVVFIGNHMSTLETMVVPFMVASVMEATFVVKEKLVTGPFFGPIMRARDPIPVGRTNPREVQVVDAPQNQVQAGRDPHRPPDQRAAPAGHGDDGHQAEQHRHRAHRLRAPVGQPPFLRRCLRYVK